MPEETVDSLDNIVEKFTLAPIVTDLTSNFVNQCPIAIADSISCENVSGWISPKQFEFWGEYIAPKDRDVLAGVTHALVHRYRERRFFRGKPDVDSRTEVNYVFNCLRIIRPTSVPFRSVQGYFDNEQVEITGLSLSTAPRLHVPITQVLNRVNAQDIDALVRLFPGYKSVTNEPQNYLQRALFSYEQAYSSGVSGQLQFLSWMMGLEGVLSKGKELTMPQFRQAILRNFSDLDIKKPEWDTGPYFSDPLMVQQVVDDLIELRNAIVHARRYPESLQQQERDHLGASHSRADYLNAAAAAMLRIALLKEIKSRVPVAH